MVLTTQGNISLLDVASEFGVTTPVSFSDFYRNGGIVPDTCLTAPLSGQITLGNFYSANNAVSTLQVTQVPGLITGDVATDTNGLFAFSTGGSTHTGSAFLYDGDVTVSPGFSGWDHNGTYVGHLTTGGVSGAFVRLHSTSTALPILGYSMAFSDNTNLISEWYVLGTDDDLTYTQLDHRVIAWPTDHPQATIQFQFPTASDIVLNKNGFSTYVLVLHRCSGPTCSLSELIWCSDLVGQYPQFPGQVDSNQSQSPSKLYTFPDDGVFKFGSGNFYDQDVTTYTDFGVPDSGWDSTGKYLGAAKVSGDFGSVFGAMTTIRCSQPTGLYAYQITCYDTINTPSSWYVMGSNDTTFWYNLDGYSQYTWTTPAGDPLQFLVNPNNLAVNLYTYFKVVFVKSNGNSVFLSELSFTMYPLVPLTTSYLTSGLGRLSQSLPSPPTTTPLSLVTTNPSRVIVSAGFSGLGWFRYDQGYFADDPTFFSKHDPSQSGRSTGWTNVSPVPASTDPAFLPISSTSPFSFLVSGYFAPRITGSYSFKLTSSDAAYLWIGFAAAVPTFSKNLASAKISLPGPHNIMNATVSLHMIARVFYPISIMYGSNTSTGNGHPYMQFAYQSPGYDFFTRDGTGLFFNGFDANTITQGSGDTVIASYADHSQATIIASNTPSTTIGVASAPGLGWFRYDSGYFNDDLSFFKSKYNGASDVGMTTGWAGVNQVVGDSNSMYLPISSANGSTFVISGYFFPNFSGLHQFFMSSSDASYLWLGDAATVLSASKKISDASISIPGIHPLTQGSLFSMIMTAGHAYPLSIIYGMGSVGDLQFSFATPDSTTFTNDGTGYFFNDFPSSIVTVPTPIIAGPNASLIAHAADRYHGLKWKRYDQGYYNDNLTFFVVQASSAFGTATGWLGTNPTSNVIVDQFKYLPTSVASYSMSLQGYFLAPSTGTYSFMLTGGDATYMWIGASAYSRDISTALIALLGKHAVGTSITAQVSMIAGQVYPLYIAYGQSAIGGNLKFSFATPENSGTFVNDGTGYLYHDGPTAGGPEDPGQGLTHLSMYTYPSTTPTGPMSSGLVWFKYKQGYFDDTPSFFAGLSSSDAGYTTGWLDVTSNPRTDSGTCLIANDGNSGSGFSFVVSGFFVPLVSGEHEFLLTSSDASYLWIGDAAAVPTTSKILATSTLQLPGIHTSKSSGTVTLNMTAGQAYPVSIMYGKKTFAGLTRAMNLVFSFAIPGAKTFIEDGDGYFFNDFPFKLESQPSTPAMTKVSGMSVALLSPGLEWFRYDQGYFNDDPTFFKGLTYTASGLASGWTGVSPSAVNQPTGFLPISAPSAFSFIVSGYFHARLTGTVTLKLGSGDAGYLWVGAAAQVLDYAKDVLQARISLPGIHSVRIKAIELPVVADQYYPIAIMYGQNGGAEKCDLQLAYATDLLGYTTLGDFYSNRKTSYVHPVKDTIIPSQQLPQPFPQFVAGDLSVKGRYTFSNSGGFSTGASYLYDDDFSTFENFNADYGWKVNGAGNSSAQTQAGLLAYPKGQTYAQMSYDDYAAAYCAAYQAVTPRHNNIALDCPPTPPQPALSPPIVDPYPKVSGQYYYAGNAFTNTTNGAFIEITLTSQSTPLVGYSFAYNNASNKLTVWSVFGTNMGEDGFWTILDTQTITPDQAAALPVGVMIAYPVTGFNNPAFSKYRFVMKGALGPNVSLSQFSWLTQNV